MTRRKKSSGFGMLGAAFAGSGSKRRGKRGGLVNIAPSINGRKRRGQRWTMADNIDTFKAFRGKGRRSSRGGITAQAARSFRDRMTPTERAQIQQELDETIENDTVLSGQTADQKLVNQPWYQRLMILARERFRKPVL